MTDDALRLSDEELVRYSRMAEFARGDEADLWAMASSAIGVDRDPAAPEACRRLLDSAGLGRGGP